MELGLWVARGASVVVIEDELAHRAIPRAHLQRGLCDCRGLREGKGVVCRLGVVGTAVPPAAFDLGLIHGIAPDVADVWTGKYGPVYRASRRSKVPHINPIG